MKDMIVFGAFIKGGSIMVSQHKTLAAAEQAALKLNTKYGKHTASADYVSCAECKSYAICERALQDIHDTCTSFKRQKWDYSLDTI